MHEQLKIINYPDPRLKKASKPVEKIDDAIRKLAVRMFELMREHKGVGLAAPQVGENIRLFVMNPTDEEGGARVYVNPVLTEPVGAATDDEGCLSIPGVTVAVRRAEKCAISGVDVQGRPVSASGGGLIARCWQHEVDHLDGRLIIDKMSEGDVIANRKKLRELETKFKKRK